MKTKTEQFEEDKERLLSQMKDCRSVRTEIISIKQNQSEIKQNQSEMIKFLKNILEIVTVIYDEVDLSKEIKIALALKKAGSDEARNTDIKTK